MPVGFEVEFNDEEIKQLVETTKQAIRRAQELVAIEVYGNIGREAPVDQGKLAGDWTIEAMGDMDWRIYTNTKYAAWVHDGTGVHGPAGQRIYPQSAAFLVFEWQGQTWWLRSTAGQPPNPYADRAIDQAEGRIGEFIERALAEVGG